MLLLKRLWQKVGNLQGCFYFMRNEATGSAIKCLATPPQDAFYHSSLGVSTSKIAVGSTIPPCYVNTGGRIELAQKAV